MLAVSAMAGVLGWSSAHTIVRVYDQAVTLLAPSGQPAPPNPFLLKPALSLLGNMVVYITLIGALLALVLGHLSLAEDKGNGVGRLVFSRHVSRTRYAMGKMLGCAAALTGLVAVCLLVSAAALLVVNHSLSAPDLGRLALFYALSWVYLMTFVLIGAVTVLATRSRSLALLAALAVWLVATFAVPQVTSGLRPTQSLNPVIEPVGTSQTLLPDHPARPTRLDRRAVQGRGRSHPPHRGRRAGGRNRRTGRADPRPTGPTARVADRPDPASRLLQELGQ